MFSLCSHIDAQDTSVTQMHTQVGVMYVNRVAQISICEKSYKQILKQWIDLFSFNICLCSSGISLWFELDFLNK